MTKTTNLPVPQACSSFASPRMLAVRALAGACGLVLAAGTSTACTSRLSPSSSSESRSDNIALSASAQSDGSVVKVYVKAAHGITNLEVSGGDELVATLDDAAVVLHAEEDASGVHYVGSAPAPTKASTFVVSLLRPAGKASAPSSTTQVPAPFVVTGLPATLREGDAITLSTDRASVEDGTPYLELLGECLSTSENANRFLLAPRKDGSGWVATVPALHHAGSDHACIVHAHVTVEAVGKVDRALDTLFSTIVGSQDRLFEAQLAPK